MSFHKIKSMDIPENQNYMVAGTISFVPESEYKKILEDNIELKKQINQYYDNERLLKETIKNNEQTIEQLKKENVMLKIELAQLKQKIQEQDVIIKEQNIKITKLEQDVKELKERDIPITIREAMTILENHAMIEIVGSKRQANRYYGLSDLSSRDAFKLIYEKFLITNSISQDHIDLMLEFKKEGNKYAHSYRPSYNKDEWRDLLINSLDDPQNQQDIKMIDDILVLMEKYNPIGDPWIMNKP